MIYRTWDAEQFPKLVQAAIVVSDSSLFELSGEKVPAKRDIKHFLFFYIIQQQCDSEISDILAEAEAQDYASHFARHRITWEMLKTMTDKELKEVSEAVFICHLVLFLLC